MLVLVLLLLVVVVVVIVVVVKKVRPYWYRGGKFLQHSCVHVCRLLVYTLSIFAAKIATPAAAGCLRSSVPGEFPVLGSRKALARTTVCVRLMPLLLQFLNWPAMCTK